jgi:Protein of unknown function (DUF3887)
MNTAAARQKNAHAICGITVAGTVLAAAFLTLTACDSAGQGRKGAVSTTTSAAAAPNSPAPGQDDNRALKMLDAIIQGDSAGARTHFDSVMQKKLSCQKLSSAWADYQQTLGSYQSHGDPQDVSRGDFTVVNISLQMSQLPGQFRVTFHDDGSVAGLFFLRAGVPVP